MTSTRSECFLITNDSLFEVDKMMAITLSNPSNEVITCTHDVLGALGAWSICVP